MKRKMVYAGTAWAAGLASAAVIGYAPAVFAFVLAASFLFRILIRFDLKSIIFMLIVFCTAFEFYNAYDVLVYKKIISFKSDNVSYSGTVTDFRDYSDNNSVYFLDGKINGHTRAKLMVYTKSIMCEPGDKMSFECTVEIPENNYIFKSRDYYKSKGIYLRTDSANNIIVKSSAFSVRKFLFRFREKVSEIVESSVPSEESGMIKGMLFGDKSGIYEEDMTMLYRIGIGHVTSVSGLHLVLFCTLISFVFRRLNTGVIAEFAVSEIFMLLFALCCGMSVSVLRACVMMTLVNLAPLFFRYTDSLNSICIAAILLTLPNPFLITNQSFALSISGALGAGVFAPYMTSGMRSDGLFRKLLKNAAYLLCVSAAVTPASIVCFGELSLVSPISNLFIAPACMAAILIAMIASMTIFLNPVFLFKISGAICRMVLNVSRFIGTNRFTHVKLIGDKLSIIIAILVIFCIITYLIFRNKSYSAASVVLSAVIIFISSAFYNIVGSGIMKIAMLGSNEIGVIVVSKGRSVDIIDISGKSDNVRYAAKYIESLGVSDIDSILLTKNQYMSMAAYDHEFSFCRVENVVLPSDSHVRQDILICGCKPKYSEFLPWSVDYGSYTICVEGNGIFVDSGKINFKYINGGDGQKKYIPNTALYISDDGKYDFRRLEDG